MIDLIHGPHAREAALLVHAALSRSFTQSQLRLVDNKSLSTSASDVIVAIDPDKNTASRLLKSLECGNRKLVLLGSLPDCLVSHMRLQKCEWPNDIARMARSVRAPKHAFSESVAEITYNPDAAILAGFTWQRALERFDFSDEWNNLGFGAVRVDGSKWSLAMPVQSQHSCSIAEVCVNTSPMLAYSALEDREGSSVLWYNRQVGPIDSFEWRLVEMFISSWRYDELPCRPVIQEIPWAYDAAVTMRLDCDEDIASAMPLKYAYDTMGIPLSLAINTNNLDGYNHNALLMELVAQGGSILSHSATHAPNWGGNYEAALYEAQESACQLQGVTGTKVRYAVSPFHQTPKFALQALVDAGYSGCIGGIISSDPEFLLARGGALSGLPPWFVGHSQQCMLHGDCMLADGDPLAIFKSAFDQAVQTRTLFGFLDHPFSERYAYGWSDEASRITAHKEFIKYIKSSTPKTLFLSIDEALDFLLYKSQWKVIKNSDHFEVVAPLNSRFQSALSPTLEYHGQYFEGQNERLVI